MSINRRYFREKKNDENVLKAFGKRKEKEECHYIMLKDTCVSNIVGHYQG